MFDPPTKFIIAMNKVPSEKTIKTTITRLTANHNSSKPIIFSTFEVEVCIFLHAHFAAADDFHKFNPQNHEKKEKHSAVHKIC